mmetsp:Transcript_48143/g.120604  ORF Transcript_48143/g.120604 Transcript_48143/m.120604 type:complete len:417 (+) Transcript_48143:84-1334(+)|eukprot:jgi/Tetstr1/444345/TSEL_032236.t1
MRRLAVALCALALAALCKAHTEPWCFALREHWENPEEQVRLYTHAYLPAAGEAPRRATCPRRQSTEYALDPCGGHPLAAKPRIAALSNECRIPPRFFDEEFAAAMRGRALWLWGDATMRELFETILACNDVEGAPVSPVGGPDGEPHRQGSEERQATRGAQSHDSAQPRGWNQMMQLAQRFATGLPPELAQPPTYAACRHIACAALPTGVPVCFMHHGGGGISEGSEGPGGPDIPCLSVPAPGDIMLLNFGAGKAPPHTALLREARRLAEWKRQRDATRVGAPQLIWREFLPEHYNASGGCLARVSIHRMMSLNGANGAVAPLLAAAGVPVLPVWRLGVQLPWAHPGGDDCTAWCQYEGDALEEAWKLLQLLVLGLLSAAAEGVHDLSEAHNIELGTQLALQHGVTLLLESPLGGG